MPSLTGAEWPALQFMTVPTAAAILLFAAGMAALLAHVLHKARSQDWVVALGWALGGSIAVASALWSLLLLGWMSFGAASGGMRAEPFAAAWGVALGGCLLAVLASRVLPSHRAANPLVVALMLPTWTVVFVVLGSALDQPPNWQALSAGPTLAALAAAGVGLALGLQLVHGPRRRWARRATGQRLAGVVAIAVGVLVAQAIALRSLPPPLAAAPAGGLTIEPWLVLVALGFGAFCVLMALLCAAVDSRSGHRAHALAGSLQLANRRLRELAFRDALTGLPNRLHFEERLDETLDAVGRQYAAMAVLFIDLDGFKAVNETYGHGAGDEVLREVGRRLHGVARAQDTAARIGGDEFLLLVAAPGSHEAAAQVAQQALHALMAPYRLPAADGGSSSELRLSCSIGIAVFPEHGPTSRLIGNADAAMLAVKRTGGSTYAFYDTRMDQASGEALELQTDLRLAIERGELVLFYQPKVDARTRELTGVEALVRWPHAERGHVDTGELIAVAERFGLIGAVGQWVIDEACRQVRAWGDQGLRMRVAVNLSAHQLRQDDLVPRIRQSIDVHRIDASLLTFEITESVAMEDTQITMRSFAQLARAGVSLAIDDFGTGHSSLAYLRTLPAQQLKIDRSFIGDLGQSGDAMAVVDAVIRLAHALGLRVVAEGVETERQREILSTLGCDEFQGYLFARPMDAERLAIWASGEASTRDFLERTQPIAKGDEEPPRLLQ